MSVMAEGMIVIQPGDAGSTDAGPCARRVPGPSLDQGIHGLATPYEFSLPCHLLVMPHYHYLPTRGAGRAPSRRTHPAAGQDAWL